MLPETQEAASKLWARILRQPNGCWEWQGSRMPEGYGQLKTKIGEKRTHRIAYAVTHGPIPDGKWVLHKCDNPPCCNPDHLFLGTRQDNIRDRNAKGRSGLPTGENHPRARLTTFDVRMIREDQRPINQIADDYHVSPGHIGNIKSRRVWKHVF